MKKYLIFSIILISSFFIIDKVSASVELYNGDIVSDFPSACANTKNIVIQNTSKTEYRLICINNNKIGDYILTRLTDLMNDSYLFNINFNTNIGTITKNTIGVQNIYRLYKNNLSGSWSYVGRNNEYGFRARVGPEYYLIKESNGQVVDYSDNYQFAQYSNVDLYFCESGVSRCTPQLVYKVHQDPEATYEIEDGSNYGKKLIFHFSNFDSNSYFTITNLSSGTTFTIDDLANATDYFIDDISYDSVFYVEAYNDDELVFVDTIDINQDLVLNGNPYIDLVLDKERLISYLEFYELKSNYKVYYSINNGTFNEVQVQSGNNHVLVAFNNDMPEIHNTNYTIRGQIRDSEDNILYDKAYNIVFFDNLPYFTFKTSYNNNTGCNEVNITYHNFQSGDIASYSYDNSNFTNFSYDKYEYLDVCSNTPIYTKAVRGNNTYYGYFYVNVMEYESTSNEQYYSYNGDLFSTFNSLFKGVDISFLNNISSTWNSLKSTYVFKFMLLCIVGAMILFIMKLIRR